MKNITRITGIILLILIVHSCKKDKPTSPVLTTTAISGITATTAISGGNITSDGGATVSERGVCWNTLNSPTTANSKTSDGTGTGDFSSILTGLTGNTKYYIRAFATNGVSTAYGNEIDFTTSSAGTSDIDGNSYTSLTIGTQVWMKENLKTTKYNNGDLIGTTSPATLNIGAESLPKYQWAYDANENNVTTYGRLYTWFAAIDSRNVCPKGWHVPTDTEWSALNFFLGGEGVSGGKLKETGLSHWITPNSDANNSSGFTAVPAGWRYYGGASEYLSYFSYWWSSTEENVDNAWWRQVNYGGPSFSRNTMNKKFGLSVRCIKDN